MPVAVRLRRHMTPQGSVAGELLLVQFKKGKIAEIRADGRPVAATELEAPVLATYYGDESREKWPVQVKDLPEHVVRAVLAAEDDSFYWHPGVSPTGIVRALFVNLRHGEVTQGGSTLTQQLVKNVFLTSERSFFRKIREAFIAVAVEVQHRKKTHPSGVPQRHLSRRRQRHPVLRPRHRGAGLLRQGRQRADPAGGRGDRRHDQVPRLLLAGRPPRPRAPAAGRGAPPHGRAGLDRRRRPGARPGDAGRDLLRCASATAPRPALRGRHGERGPRPLRPAPPGQPRLSPLLDALDAGPGARPPGGDRHPAQPRPPGAPRRRSARGRADLGRSPAPAPSSPTSAAGTSRRASSTASPRPTARPGAASSRSSSWPRWRAASTRRPRS